MRKGITPSPPRWATKFLEWYCRAELLEDLQGDLNEYFHRNLEARGLRWAQFQYVIDVLKFFRPYIFRIVIYKLNVDLYLNYSKAAFRAYNRQRGFTVLNILSLTLGLSTVLLLLLHIYTEWSFDRHIPESERIYRVTTGWQSEADMESTELGWSLSPLPEQLRYSFPEVEDATGIARIEKQIRVNVAGETFLEDDFFNTDASYFNVCPQRWIQGEASGATSPSGIVLTESLKKKYYGDREALGETIEINDASYKISGVIEDVPYNTTIRFKALLFTMASHNTDWCFTFLRTHKNADVTSLSQRLDTLFNEVYSDVLAQSNLNGAYHLEKLSDVHFGDYKAMDPPKGNLAILSAMSVLAVIVMLISVANYINLTISHSSGRLRETGIRIVMGAQRLHTRIQAITESMWMSLISVILSITLVIYAWPKVMQTSLSDYAMRWNHVSTIVAVVAGVFVAISVVTGWIISKRRIASHITQAVKSKGTTSHMLMIAQCAVSVCLVFGADVIAEQVRLLSGETNHSNQVMVINLPYEQGEPSSLVDFKRKLHELPFVDGSSFVASGAVPAADAIMDIFTIDVPGGQQIRTLPYALVDEDFFTTLNLKFVAGKGFAEGDSSDAWEEVIVNEAFVKSQGWTDDPLSHSMHYGMEGKGNPVIGVVHNFGFSGFQRPEKPTVFFKNHKPAEKMMVRLSQSESSQLEEIRQLWYQVVKEPFEFRFLDEYYEQQLAQERHIAQQVTIFSWIAVLIAVTGIAGMIFTSVHFRKKEMAIRTIFGAQYKDILMISWRKILAGFAITICIACPLVFAGLSQWLTMYPLQTPLSLADYMIAVVIMTIVFTIAILFHLILLRRTKTLDAIRYE